MYIYTLAHTDTTAFTEKSSLIDVESKRISDWCYSTVVWDLSRSKVLGTPTVGQTGFVE